MEIIVQNEHIVIAVEKIQNLEFYKSYLENKQISDKLESILSVKRKCELLNNYYMIHKLTNTLQTYSYNKYNKPITDKTRHFVGISHSNNYTAIALSQKNIIGIDIEENNRDFVKISRKYLNEEEKIFATDNYNCQLIWCAKEAIYKLLDESSNNFAEDYKVIDINDDSIYLEYKKSKIFTVNFLRNENYLLTWSIYLI